MIWVSRKKCEAFSVSKIMSPFIDIIIIYLFWIVCYFALFYTISFNFTFFLLAVIHCVLCQLWQNQAVQCFAHTVFLLMLLHSATNTYWLFCFTGRLKCNVFDTEVNNLFYVNRVDKHAFSRPKTSEIDVRVKSLGYVVFLLFLVKDLFINTNHKWKLNALEKEMLFEHCIISIEWLESDIHPQRWSNWYNVQLFVMELNESFKNIIFYIIIIITRHLNPFIRSFIHSEGWCKIFLRYVCVLHANDNQASKSTYTHLLHTRTLEWFGFYEHVWILKQYSI